MENLGPLIEAWAGLDRTLPFLLSRKDVMLTAEKTSWIENRPDVYSGDACIRNTRIPVWLLVYRRREGMSDQAMLRQYLSLEPEDLDAAWKYYAGHIEEIDAAMADPGRAKDGSLILLTDGSSFIRSTPDVCGGDACIRNTRIMVWLLISMIQQGDKDNRLLKGYPGLTPEDLDAAREFYRLHPAEIEQAIRENHEDNEDA